MNDSTPATKETKYGYTKEGKVYQRGLYGNPDRQIGIVKTTDEEALAYFEKRFDDLREKVERMLDEIEVSQNKGSFLMKLIHMRESMPAYEALGDFDLLSRLLEAKETELRGQVVYNREKNLEVKKTLIEEAKEISKIDDLREAVFRMKDLRQRWLKTGAIEKDHKEDVEVEFSTLVDTFYQSRKEEFEARRIEIEERTEKYNSILKRAKEIQSFKDNQPIDTIREIKIFENEWRDVGHIPKPLYKPLWLEFKDIKRNTIRSVKNFKRNKGFQPPTQIFIPKFINPEEKHLYDNLQFRLKLVEEAENLDRYGLDEAVEVAKNLQSKWKDGGMVPDKFKSPIFHRFNKACDRIFELNYLMKVVYRKFPYFDSLTDREKHEAKLEAMRSIIFKEEKDIKFTQEQYEALSPAEREMPDYKIKFTRLNTSKRKLKSKQALLEELQRSNKYR